MTKKSQEAHLEYRMRKCKEMVQSCKVIPSFSYAEYQVKIKLLNSYKDTAHRELDAFKQATHSQWETQYKLL